MDVDSLLVTIEQQERNISQLELELAQLQSPGGTLDSTEKVSGWNIVPSCYICWFAGLLSTLSVDKSQSKINIRNVFLQGRQRD